MFGQQKTTKVTDANGSKVTTQKNIVNGETMTPVRQYYEVKVRVHNQKEEHEEYVKFSDELKRDKTMLDPAFRIEKTKIGNENGYYYVTRVFTQLEY